MTQAYTEWCALASWWRGYWPYYLTELRAVSLETWLFVAGVVLWSLWMARRIEGAAQ